MAVTNRIYHYGKGPPRATTKKRDNPEHRFQCAVAKYLTYALPPDWKFTASAAGVYLGEKLAGEMKAAGQHPGWSDLILRQVKTGRTRWLECKSATGRLTPEQIAFRDDCPEVFAVARTLEDVEAALIGWGIKPRCSVGNANRYYVGEVML